MKRKLYRILFDSLAMKPTDLSTDKDKRKRNRTNADVCGLKWQAFRLLTVVLFFCFGSIVYSENRSNLPTKENTESKTNKSEQSGSKIEKRTVLKIESMSTAFRKTRTDKTLSGTDLLDWKDDIGQRLMQSAQDLMDQEIAKSSVVRDSIWKFNGKTVEEYSDFLKQKRVRLAEAVGFRDNRLDCYSPEFKRSVTQSEILEENKMYTLFQIRWKVFDDFQGEGILVEPKGDNPVEKSIVAIPHAGISALRFFKSLPELQKEAASGRVRIVIPDLLDRRLVKVKPNRYSKTEYESPAREFIYRTAYMLGRHVIGYELHSVSALLDWLCEDSRSSESKLVVGGYGDGGMLTLYLAALDERVKSAVVAGYFGPRELIWKEPLDRNVYGRLNEFGDAELAALIWPRELLIDLTPGPTESVVPKTFTQGRSVSCYDDYRREFFPAFLWAPGELIPIESKQSLKEVERAKNIVPTFNVGQNWLTVSAKGATSLFATEKWMAEPNSYKKEFDAIQIRYFKGLDRHNQELLKRSALERERFMSKLDFSSIENYEKSTHWYRNCFEESICGRFDKQYVPFAARTRQCFDTPDWTGYEVVFDVFDGLFVYGMYYIPKNLKPGETRPAVVFQHGRSGSPECGVNGKVYRQAIPKLLGRGYPVFAPQNIYILGDQYRLLQRKCNAVGKTFYAIINAQHKRIIDWLRTRPEIQNEKIGFYGISYGGKSAVFTPPVVTDYALSICNSDFNERVVKCGSSSEDFSFAFTCEYEMYEFNIADRFNYFEQTALIAPRPFLVERGYSDGVGRDQYVAFEFAKVRRLYDKELGLKDRAVLVWFDGVHEIRAVEALDFIDRFLKKENEPAKKK